MASLAIRKLRDLRDVDDSAIANGKTLVYRTASGKHEYEAAGGGVTDHGALTGLADDDHPQYHTDADGDARYWPLATDLATQAELDAHAAAADPHTAYSGAARVLGPFPFAFDDPGLEDGIAFYTPTVGDVLLNAWIEVETGFDGTTPFAEIGTFVGSNNGLFNFSLGAPDISMADAEWIGAGMQHGSTMTSAEHNQAAYASTLTAQVDGAGPYLTLQPNPTFLAARGVPLKFSSANPLKIVVSQNGAKGGTAVGGSAGAAGIYLIVSTPSLT